MESRKYRPAGELGAFVECFWYWESAPMKHARERLMPKGEASIIFNLLDDPICIYDAEDTSRYTSHGTAVISGARTNCFAIDTSQEERVFGIQFQPGGAFPFFRPPASELKNTAVSLECLWKGVAGELRERLLAAPTRDSMFALTEEYLLGQLVRQLELHPAVAFAREHFCRTPHATTVTAVLGQIGLSQHRFIELFHDQVGLSPKAFCRVRRFQRVLQTVHGTRDVDWAQVALDCGYYDQPHFIHDFRAFSGLTPVQYLARATEHLNHVPME
jgi:AraC-like DNA-binding protein